MQLSLSTDKEQNIKSLAACVCVLVCVYVHSRKCHYSNDFYYGVADYSKYD